MILHTKLEHMRKFTLIFRNVYVGKSTLLPKMGNQLFIKTSNNSSKVLHVSKKSLKESIKKLNVQFLIQYKIRDTRKILPIFTTLISNLEQYFEQVLLILIMFQYETTIFSFNANEYSRLHLQLTFLFVKNKSFISRNLKNLEIFKNIFEGLNNDLYNIIINLYIKLKWLDDSITKNGQHSLEISGDIIKYASDLFTALDLVFPELKENIDT